MNLRALPLCVAILLCGCATGYKSNGIGGGFSETALAPDVYRVKFQGNGYTSPERATDFALLRACELSLKNGYPLFAVVNETKGVRAIDYTMPTTTTTQGTATRTGTNTADYRGTSTTSPAITTHIRAPSSGLVVKMLKSGEPDGITTFDAKWLQASLKKRYDVE